MDKRQVVVIGGSKGIGKAIVEEFLAKGCDVLFSYYTSRAEALRLIEIHKHAEQVAETHELDVKNKESIRAFADFVDGHFQTVHSLVYCTGIVKDNAMFLMEDTDFEEVLSTNLNGCFYTVKSLLPLLDRKKGASIVIISSTGGVRAEAGQTNYAASKAGLTGLMESMAREFADRKIRVNAVAPGFIETSMVNLDNPKIRKSVEQIPMKRLGRPEEVAKAVYFLSSEDASYITAQTLLVDGGRL